MGKLPCTPLKTNVWNLKKEKKTHLQTAIFLGGGSMLVFRGVSRITLVARMVWNCTDLKDLGSPNTPTCEVSVALSLCVVASL